ncbi:YbaB/EbfC family DNA-binding protein [Solihabitans fulvus]|uniref:YbaB/EbfC family DNA-binding protein n=1 Tax=Solihabitans fulvus TaxID=1892852 RepID=A0A5B2WH84_9PSEU|nr:YbaB/EbfC family nucleoid-associated protein [Solihabitans fulvus]KAA2251201.1 YbaB/EbfC family DNA-binding protein [Solihabitans fulvus]
MSQEFEDLVRQFERFQEGVQPAEDALTRYDGMQDEITAVHAAASSPDRTVTVTAGPGGAVTNIQITDRALHQGASALSSAVLAAMHAAVADAARQQAEIVQRYVGDSMNVLDQVLETQAEVLGTPVEELRASLQPPAEQQAKRADEDFSDRELLRKESATPDEPVTPQPTTKPVDRDDEYVRSMFNREDDY